MTEVTQADREAAAKLLPLNTLAECERAIDVKAGRDDRNYLVQAFAAHRLAARAELLAELSEPTEAMVDAGKRFYSSNHRANAIGIFRAMIAKAGE